MTQTFKEWIAARRALEAAEQTMVCFQKAGIGYAVVAEVKDGWVKMERESSKRGGKVKARIRLNSMDIAALMNKRNLITLGTMESLEALYRDAYIKATGKSAPKNLGWMFECAVTEILAKESWEPDKVPFWKAPDVTINGIGYQIKANGAEWFNESSIQKAMQETGY